MLHRHRPDHGNAPSAWFRQAAREARTGPGRTTGTTRPAPGTLTPAEPHPCHNATAPVAARRRLCVIVGQNPVIAGVLAHNDPRSPYRGTGVVTEAIYRAAPISADRIPQERGAGNGGS